MARGLEGSFSSGQVADPLGMDSKKNSGPKVKGNVLDEFSSKVCNRNLLSEFLDFRPDQGMATEAELEKHSNDLIVFGWEREDSSPLMQFHTYMLESSHAETICFPSSVKDADVWFPAFRRPLYFPITLTP